MEYCHICSAEMDDDPESLHLNCGGDCRWCMARSGDPDCRDSILHLLKEDCLREMTEVFNSFRDHVIEIDGDWDLFGMQVMEQWRPW